MWVAEQIGKRQSMTLTTSYLTTLPQSCLSSIPLDQIQALPVQNPWQFPITYRRAILFKALHTPSLVYFIIIFSHCTQSHFRLRFQSQNTPCILTTLCLYLGFSPAFLPIPSLLLCSPSETPPIHNALAKAPLLRSSLSSSRRDITICRTGQPCACFSLSFNYCPGTCLLTRSRPPLDTKVYRKETFHVYPFPRTPNEVLHKDIRSN